MNASPPAQADESGRPLAVDLDGTLLRSDLLLESFFALLKVNPLYIFLIPIWLFGGKARLKDEIARRVDLDVELLPYNQPFLAYLSRERQGGRRILLATASNERLARQVADHLGLFESVLASDQEQNLKGGQKLERLRARFGERGFDYAGNDEPDLKIWAHANAAILVNAHPRIREQVQATSTPIERTFSDDKADLRTYLRALRLHQWLKNLLIFAPIFAAHQFYAWPLLAKSAIAFLAFGLCASSVYILNDLLDLSADRRHPRKCKRPFASGALPLVQGVVMIPLLLLAASVLALATTPEFALVLAGYFALTLAYSLRLKQIVLVDVIVLSGLYTVRVIAGCAATSIEPSFWLLGFSMFLFLSLAMIKRYAELLSMKSESDSALAGRGYRTSDLATLNSFGAASGYLAVLVLALYIHSDNVPALYSRPQVIWLLLPLLMYWISRMWLAAARDKMHDDPLVYAITDRGSQWVALIGIAVLLLGI